MEIVIKRIYFREHYVVGALQVDGKYLCDTLEPHAIDWKKEKKIKGVTAIPEGRYRVEIRHSPTFHRQMPYLKDVPEFTGIMIHTGNRATNPDGTPADSRGCILVGQNLEVGIVLNSRQCFKRLFTLMEAARSRGEEIWVTVRSYNGWTYG